MKYKKKPVVIEAFRYWIDNRPDWFCDKVSSNEIITYPTHCEINTLEGVMRGEVGDYIIQGVQGEVYPCKPDIFEQTYEKVEDTHIWTSNEWWKGNGTVTVPNDDLVPFHTICGCTTCGCITPNRMVRKGGSTITSTSTRY
jgi:hypothetical protein